MIASSLAPSHTSNILAAMDASYRVPSPGGAIEPYRLSKTPYFADVLAAMQSRNKTSVIYCGPSQTGKSEALMNGFLWNEIVTGRLASTLVLLPNVERASSWSIKFDRMIRDNQLTGAFPPGRSQTMSRKLSSDGQTINILSPTPSSVSGRPYKLVIIDDSDRLTDHHREGSFIDLAKTRLRTAGSRGLLVVNSSPAFDLTADYLDWEPTSQHEAPPVPGILSLYNGGDRRQLYCMCIHCSTYFNPGFDLDSLVIPEEGSIIDRAYNSAIPCPSCGGLHFEGDRHGLIQSSKWLGAGQHFEGTEIIGDLMQTQTASFWMSGLLASFASIPMIATNIIKANDTFEHTGSEAQRKVVLNNDLAGVYKPLASLSSTTAAELSANSIESDQGTVPAGTRALIASVDVQGGSFEVQVTAVGNHFLMQVIDRFSIKYSARKDDKGQLRVSPHTHPEDWVLLDNLLDKVYKGPDGDYTISMMLCDSSGQAGASKNAYRFAESLRFNGKSRRFRLVKGRATGEFVKITNPDSRKRKDRDSSQGKVPLVLINTNEGKDMLFAALERTDGDVYRYLLPDWLHPSYFRELCAEVRDTNGKWLQMSGKSNRRNEAIDLGVYCFAGLQVLGYDGKRSRFYPGTPQAAITTRVFQPHNPRQPRAVFVNDIEEV